MIDRFKKVLGIEGVKIKLKLNSPYRITDKFIDGVVILDSKSDAIVQHIQVQLIEKYERGRRDKKLINDYIIGNLEFTDKIIVKKDQQVEIPFKLDFIVAESPMDNVAKDSIFYKGVVSLAKMIKGVKSSYSISAKVKTKGTKLDAVYSEPIVIK